MNNDFPDPRFPTPGARFWAQWAQLVVGQHGMPPKLSTHGVTRPLDADSFFTEDDVSAARQFVRDLAFLLPDDLPQPTSAMAAALRQCSWTLAGFAILADWLGSNTEYFLYHDQPCDLQDYWQYAQQQAAEAIAACGLLPATPAVWRAEPVRVKKRGAVWPVPRMRGAEPQRERFGVSMVCSLRPGMQMQTRR